MHREVADGVHLVAAAPYVNTVLVRGAEGWTIVDAGLSPTAARLVRRMRSAGVRRGDVERVVLTHGHLDHAGGADLVRREFGAREVLVGAQDLASVRAGRSPAGSPPGPGYPPVVAAGPAPVEVVLGDGRTLAVVPTPGHTAGHVSLHLVEERVVIGGDVVFNVFGLRPSPGFLCADAPANADSVRRLADLDPSMLLLAHGPPVDGDVAGRLRELVGT